MKIEDIKSLSDSELALAIAWGQEEQKARAERKKQETIARIKELAASVGVAVNIKGQRGRPAKAELHRRNEKPHELSGKMAGQKSAAS